ncbi:MAG: hypothetical protein SGJ17_04115 [Hyphomicrobiales bacterium]|nr:hypothetical protein [Hyphomicrobiales bacterium]
MFLFKIVRRTAKELLVVIIAGLCGASFAQAQETPSQKAALGARVELIDYRNDRYGFRLRYPAATFKPDEPTESGDGQTFLTVDGQAKIVTYAALNAEKLTPQAYRKTLMSEYDGYDLLDYQPQGKTWFVLSGFRGDKIFYEKIMFSCGNQVINVLAVSFPKAEKIKYERIVEQLEDDFIPGKGAETANLC